MKQKGVFMHTFQPYPSEMLDINPFTKIGTEWMAVTAGDKDKVNTMTASWGTIGVLWGKNIVTIYVRDSRYTKEFIDAKDTFSLTFFDVSDKENKLALKYFGAVSGRDEDKISNAKMHVDYAQPMALPILMKAISYSSAAKCQLRKYCRSSLSMHPLIVTGIKVKTTIRCTLQKSHRYWHVKRRIPTEHLM